VTLKRIARTGVVILAALTGIVLFVPRPVWSYKGPGTMRDYGVLSHPRYQLKLPRMSAEQTYRSFSFAGVPSEEMTLELYIADATLDKLERPLQALDTQITAQLFEEATPFAPRRVLCSATGSPSAVSSDARWVVWTDYNTFVALWHSRCLRVPMSKDRRYTLTLEIADSGLSSLAKILVPTLEGGGYELP
jgi:hypothetical protein